MEKVDNNQDLKDAETGSDPDTDKDYASFEAGNRKRRFIIISAAIVVGVVSIAALVATMGSIGRMSAQVEDAFYDPNDPAKPSAQPKAEAEAETKTESPAQPPAESESTPEPAASSGPEAESAPEASSP